MIDCLKKKILIIENEPDIVDIISFILLEEGYDVAHQPSISTDILETIRSVNPDLILLDNWLDGISGSEFCKVLKTEHQDYLVPVVIISANADLPQIAAACKADGYIEKPFDVLPMLQVISEVLTKNAQ